MSTSVGVINLDLKINSQLAQQLDKISSQFKKITSSTIENFESTTERAFDKASEKAKNFKKTTSEAMQYDSSEISKYVDDFAIGIGTKAEEKIKKTTSVLDESIKSLTDEMREKLGTFDVSSNPTERLEKQLENTNTKMDLLQARWQELQNAFNWELSPEEFKKVSEETNRVEKQMLQLANSADKTQAQIDKLGENSKVSFKDKIKNAIEKAKESVKQLAQNGFEKLKNNVKSAISPVKNIQRAFNGLKSVGGKALNGLKNQFAKLKGNVNSMNNPLTRLGKSIKSAMKSAFLMAGLYAAFRGIKSALAEACNGNEEFAKSLNEVKANLNIAFQPIMNAIMPAINALMSGLAKATQTIAAFTSELFGSTYQKSLETVKQVKNVAKEAEKSSKHLAGFDVMNVASDSSSSSSSSDESSVDYSAINGEGVELPDWAERMKDAIRGGDWKGVGSLLAEKLNSALNINWNSIQNKVNNAVKGITDGLNSFIKKFDWGGLGKTFAEGINTIFGAAYTFVTTFDWSGFGTSIGNSINGFLTNIDTKKMGETLSNGVKGVLDLLINTIQTINWQQIGEKIADFIGAIDWSGLVSRLAEGLGSAIAGIASLLWGFIKDAWGKVVEWWNENAKKDGEFTIKGLISGLWEGIKNIGTWIKDKIFTPFINGFKKVFGIASPSKVMIEQGKYIIQGLINGVQSLIGKVKDIFTNILTTIKNVFKSVGTWFKNIFTNAFKSIKSAFSNVSSFFKGVWNNIKSAFGNISGWFKEKFVSAYNSVKSAFSNAGTFFKGVWNNIKSAFGNIANWFKNTFTKAWENVKAVFSKGGKIFDGIKDGILDGLKKVINGLIGGINKVIKKPFDGINSALKKVKNIEILGAKPFKDKIKTIDVPEIPKLAGGGLATAPTLAMVGDNKRANIDPEVISPLSKLKKMLDEGGSKSEITALLREIVELLRNMKWVFHGEINEGVLYRAIVRLNNENKLRTGVNAL